MPRLQSKSIRAGDHDALLVSFVANQAGAIHTSTRDNFNSGPYCVPFGGGTLLADRKRLVLTFPTDTMWFGTSGVTHTNGYLNRATGRGGTFSDAPNVSDYSSRKQFLRAQYVYLAALDSVEACANEFNFIETALSLELA